MMMFQSQESTDLFVYISWKTRGGKPLLADDQVRQAAYLAITKRTRTQLCRVLAISGTCTQVHAVFRFPASLAISQIGRTAMQAAGKSVAQLSETLLLLVRLDSLHALGKGCDHLHSQPARGGGGAGLPLQTSRLPGKCANDFRYKSGIMFRPCPAESIPVCDVQRRKTSPRRIVERG